ncbi:MAG: NAD(+)/NADH kinase [archaeon]
MNILAVYRKTEYEKQQERGTWRELLEKDPQEAAHLLLKHEEEKVTLDKVMQALQPYTHDLILREQFKHVQNKDLVISVGGDGTFISASHAIGDTPLLGVNATRFSVGFYTAATGDTIASMLSTLDAVPRTTLQRYRLFIDDYAIPEMMLNDVRIGDSNPAETIDDVRVNGKALQGKQYAILACTPQASTAWMWNEGGLVMPLHEPRLQYTFLSRRNKQHLFAEDLHVKLKAKHGMLYIDGSYTHYPFTSRNTIHIVPGEKLTIIGDLAKKQYEFLRDLK